MRTVNFRDGILYPVAYLLGIDPTLDLNNDHARAWCSFINSRVREGWELWAWPDLKVTEERAYRAIFNPTRQVTLDEETFYLPTFSYYKAIATPPLGALPTDPLYFEPITLSDYYIELDQAGRRPIDEMFGVYAGDPRLNGNCTVAFRFWPSEKGFDIQPYAGGLSVFISYRIRPPQFTVEPYDNAKSYRRNDRVYWTDGDCYEALQTVTGHSPDERSYWRKLPMPYSLAEFVKYAVAADACDDLSNTQLWRGYSEDALIRQINTLGEQGQTYFYKPRKMCGYLSFAPLGALGPWGTDISNTTLTSANDPYAVEGDTMMNDGLTQIISGQAYVDVDLTGTWTGGAAYSFDELVVKNTVDAPPLNIFPTIMVDQRADGFRVLLNSAPDNNNYFLKWRIVL